MRIDAHQHYWDPVRGDYDWMPKDVAWLNRPYGPADLAPLLARHRIDGTVLIQAAATVAETDYLLGIADATPSVLGVVGWIDFEDPSERATLERLAQHPKFRGVRPMIQDIPDVDWMLRPEVQWAYRALVDLDLTFDALGLPVHLDNVHRVFTRYPDLRAVIDHGMKPEIETGDPAAFRQWREGMSRLARDTDARMKFSSLPCFAGPHWTTETLRPYAHHLLDSFGPSRVMWGSDWPVIKLNADYDPWMDAATELTRDLSDTERAHIFGGTAQAFYRLSPPAP